MTQTDGLSPTDYGSAVALIGMSGRFPGAPDVDTLWRNLITGKKGLRELTEEELADGHLDPGLLADPRYVRVTGALADFDQFDAAVFGMSPREAETMGPQHRLFLECSWEALESAGYCPTDAPGQVGVFGGSGFPDYIVQNVSHLMTEPGGPLLIAVGNERDSLANLVSYKLGLRGPAIGVQTFCSTSLVSVHLACQSLLTYECDLAVAGGAFTPLPQPNGYLYEPGGITSPDGIVRSFDAAANGTVMGSGVGVVALKRMTEALADGDVIHAVILGSATNNDGRVRAGYTAPGVDGQADVIDTALGVAGVKPESIGYVECHATATALGDSIELAAMARVFTQPRDVPCVLGTLKPSLGHLDRASGVSGLMRAVMALEHQTLPGTPNYETPNPALATALDRFTVLTEHSPWPAGPSPRRAGVSSFGLGGTNAHVVLEQAPPRAAVPHRAGPHLLTFSAVDETALDALTDRLRTFLAGTDVDLADVAFTLQSSRGGFSLRRSLVCRDRADAVAALGEPGLRVDARTTRRNPKVRLSAGPEVPSGWWTELQAAAQQILGAQCTGTGADGALATLGDGLTRLGVRLDHAATDGPDTGHVEEVILAPAGDGPATEWVLAVLGRLWQAGCGLDWAALHRGEGRRVQLPTYPFQRRRFWVDPPAKSQAGADGWGAPPTTTGRTYDRSQWTHLPTWQRRPRPTADLDEQLRLAGPWLVFSADDRGEALIAHLVDCGVEVTAVRPGAAFEQDDMGDFTVRVDDSADMAILLRSLIVAPRMIVHGFSLASPEPSPDTDPLAAIVHFDSEQSRGFYSAMSLARELVDDSGHGLRMGFVILTSSAIDVAGTEVRHPEHAALAALGPSLAQENSRLRTRHIDIDAVDPGDPVGLRRLITPTLAACVGDHDGPVGVRAGELWLRRYQPFPIEDRTAENTPFQIGDTVLITGGLGDVGLTLARHLAARYQCRLVLTARSALPAREDWADYLANVPDGGERTARHIRSVVDLEERGATVLAMSADVGDVDQMRGVVQAAVETFGAIDVAVHGAGVQDSAFFNFAHLIERDACEAHFRAKVRGFHVLQAVLDGHCPDRRITLSSLAAVLGGMALAPYAAANAALDSYAAVARHRADTPWISVDWDTWNVDPSKLDGHGPSVTDFAMAPTEAVDVFERALSAADQVGRLVISTGSLEARLAQWVTGDLHESDDDDDTDNRERHPRPDLGTPFVVPHEGSEATLAEIWSRVLRIEPIGAVDNFFELGGHSLIAIDLTARIRRAFGASIPVTGLLECPTVRQLAELIDAAGTAPESAEGADNATA